LENEPAELDRRQHVGQRVMRACVGNVIRGRQRLQAEGSAAFVAKRDDKLRGRYGIRGHDETQGVSAAVSVVAREVGRIEALKQGVAQHFLVEADGVETHKDGGTPTQKCSLYLADHGVVRWKARFCKAFDRQSIGPQS
jgi:hypothetical protein